MHLKISVSLKAFSQWQIHDLWVTTSKIEQHLSPSFGKRKRKLPFKLGETEARKLKNFQNLLE